MKNISFVFHPSLLAVLLCAAGLFYSPVANACPLCEDAHDGNVEGIETRCGDDNASTIIDVQDDNGRTALFRAARANEEEVVALLLDAGPGNCGQADPNIPNQNRHTPLMAAAQKGNWIIGKKLLGIITQSALNQAQVRYRRGVTGISGKSDLTVNAISV